MLDTLLLLIKSIWIFLRALLNPIFLIPLAIIIIVYIIKLKDYKASTYYQVTKVPYFSMRRDLGRYGEYLTFKYLKRYEDSGAKFLFNVYIPKEDGGTSEIDVLMISKKGIFVFESKNYSGWIFGDEKRKDWYQTLPSGRGKSHKEHFYNPIMQNRSHIKHLKALVGEQIVMHSIIVFSERCTLKNVVVNSNDIQVINRNEVTYVVSNVCKKVTEDVLKEEDITNLYNQLYPYTQNDETVKMQHIADIKNKLTENTMTESKEVNAVSQNELEEQHMAEKIVLEPSTETTVEMDEGQKEFDQPQKVESDDIATVKSDTEETQDYQCPRCGGKLVLRTASRGANAGAQFWGCGNYPKCRYIKNIL